MNMDMVMNMEPSRGQVRHGVLARFTEHCIFTLFPGAFVGFVIQKEFFGIFLANYSQGAVWPARLPARTEKTPMSKECGRGRNGARSERNAGRLSAG